MSSSSDSGGPRSQIGRNTVRGAAVLALARPIRIAILIASTAILARLLEPSDFGLVGMAIAITRLLEVFRQVGLGAATIQRQDLSEALSNALFWVNVAVALVLAALTVGAAPAIAWFYDEQRLVHITWALALGLAISGAEVQHGALLKRNMRFTALVTVELVAALTSATVAIVCAWRGLGYWSLIAQTLSRQLVSTTLAVALSGLRIRRPRGAGGLGESVRFGFHLSSFNLINFFARNLDDILIGRFLGAQVLGLYQKAYELMMLPLRHVTAPASGVALPALSRLVSEPERYRAAYRRMLDLVLMVSTPAAAWLVGSAPSIIAALLGPKWLDAAPILQAFGVSLFVQPMTSTSGWLFTSTARTRELPRLASIMAVTVLVAVICGLPWGAVGVAWAYSASFVVRLPTLLTFLGNVGPVTWKDMLKSGAVFAPSGACSLLATLLFARLTPELPPLASAIAAAIVSGSVAIGVLACFSSGRRALGTVLRARELFAS